MSLPKTHAEQAEAPSAEATEHPSAPAWQAVARGVALFFGGMALLNLIAESRTAGGDANLWWIDVQPIPAAPARGLLSLVGIVLIAFACHPRLPGPLRRLTILITMSLFAVALWNSFVYYSLVGQGSLRTELALPFSLHVGGCLAVVLCGLFAEPSPTIRPRRDLAIGIATLLVCLVGFPLAQMYCFGQTDYRRPADAIVVFGCRTFAEGRPSPALADRVETGCRLYFDGLADKLIFSGAAGDGDVHQVEVMREMAVEQGVPADHIFLDRKGRDTQATVRNTAPQLRRHGIRHVLAVSRFSHLPRIKLSYRRAGLEVFTVPAPHRNEHRPWNQAVLSIREMVALWAYYLRPLAE